MYPFPPVLEEQLKAYLEDFLLGRLNELYEKCMTVVAKRTLIECITQTIQLPSVSFNAFLESHSYYQDPRYSIVKRLLIEYNQIAFGEIDSYPPLLMLQDQRFYTGFCHKKMIKDAFTIRYKDAIKEWLSSKI